MIDNQLFTDIKDHAAEMKRNHAAKITLFKKYEEAYLLKWAEANNKRLKGMNLRITQSPEARNAVLGALRLLIAADPIFNVKTYSDYDTDGLEASIGRWWTQSGRIAGRPIHFDALLSGVLYGEMHTAVTPMSELLKFGEKKHRDRIERRQNIAPFLLQSWNPKTAATEYDNFGLCAYYREVETTAGQVISDYGAYVSDKFRTRGRYDKVTLSMFYDLDYCCIWVGDELIWLDEHGWPEIPISVTLIDGSRLFDKPEEQSQPLLYTLLQADLWNQQNLSMTILYTMVFGLGANPMFVHRAPQSNPGKQLDLNFDIPGGTVELEPGEEFTPMVNKGAFPPEVQQAYQLAVQKGQESTIYPQALGAPVEGQMAYSALSLLSQGGRLPLVGPQRMGGEGIAGIVELGLMLLKSDGTSYDRNGIKLKPSEIPDDLEISVKLDVKLPQDKLQLANIANILKSNNLADTEWIQQNLLNINNPNEVRHNIWKERAGEAMYQVWLEQMIKKQAQMAEAPKMPQGTPQGTPPMEMSGNGPIMSPGQGEMIQGGLPPQMAGMMPVPGGE